MLLLSIISINYNNAKGLSRTMNSVFAQEKTSEWEWIVVDGLSTDEGKTILEESKKQIDVLIQEKDKGLYDAMNKGLNIAKGKYVWFMNTGDCIHRSDTVSKLLTEIKKSNLDVYYSDTYYMDLEGNILGLISKIDPHHFPKKIDKNTFKMGMSICHQSFVVKKEIVGQYNLNYKVAADIDWVLNILQQNPSHQCLDFILSQFETGGESSKQRKKALKERYRILANYYGTVPNFFHHVLIVFRKIFYSVFPKK